MKRRYGRYISVVVLCLLATFFQALLRGDTPLPEEVPPRRSTQLSDGFGANLPLPRDPRLPWTKHWWTRVADSGVKWVRLGQYENSSEKTGWDWVEQTPGVYRVLPEVDEAIRSLRDNGVSIEIQLCYNNRLYQGDRTKRPRHIDPAPPEISQDGPAPNPIFNGLDTEDEIAGFLRYTRFMVNHFKGKVQGWELWNEPNIGYWQPDVSEKEKLAAKGKRYGAVLCRFSDAVHEADPKSKVIFGGTSSVDPTFVFAALSSCPSKIDVMAYHPYPGFGTNQAPERADDLVAAGNFRESVLHLPGIRRDIEFWENEWNVIPSWRNSNESVQARYVPRFYLQTKAQGIQGFIWEFIPDTEGSEGDQYGLLHGDTSSSDAFQPRQAYRAFEVTSALFGQTQRDPWGETPQDRRLDIPEKYSHGQLKQYCFRDRTSGKPIYAAWLAINSDPDDHFQPVEMEIPVPDRQIQNPIFIDVRTGRVTPARWHNKEKRTVLLGVKDSVIAIADASYLDWPVAPAAPAALVARKTASDVQLEWKGYGAAEGFEVQRSSDWGEWQKVALLKADQFSFSERMPQGKHITYRVRAVSKPAASAWSNPAWVDVGR